MREIILSNGDKVRLGPHMERRIVQRNLDIADIRSTLENPDEVAPDVIDPRGVVLRKDCGNFTMVLCVNDFENKPFLKTGWKQG